MPDLSNKYVQRMAEMQNSDILYSAVGSGNSATARLYPSNQIICDITNGTAAKMITATINTPIAFKVMDAKAVNTAGVVGTYTVTIKNNTSAITNSLSVNGDKKIARATEIDEDQCTFAVGDNDLTVTVSGSSAGSVLVVIDIMLV